MKHVTIVAGITALTLWAAPSQAAETITVVSGIRGVTIASNGPVAQTFVATDATLTNFAFQFATSISGTTTGAITFSLLEGAGIGGTTLATQTTALTGLIARPATNPGFTDVFTGAAALRTGQAYTALLSGASSNVSLLFGPDSTSTRDAYAPGVLIKNNALDRACGGNTYCDANFRFTTAAAAASAVPEPASWALMLTGFALAGAGLRRRGGVTARIAPQRA